MSGLAAVKSAGEENATIIQTLMAFADDQLKGGRYYGCRLQNN